MRNGMMVFSALLFLALFSCADEVKNHEGFEIIGVAENVQDNTMVYIKYDNSLDSTLIKGGKFKLAGKLSSPTRAKIFLKNSDLSDWFWIENAKIEFHAWKDDIVKTKIEGGPIQKMANLHYSTKQNEIHAIDSLLNFYRTNKNNLNEAKKNVILERINTYYEKIEDHSKAFIKEYPNSYESVFTLNSKRLTWDKELIKELFSLMNIEIQGTYYGKILARHLKLNINPLVGEKYVDFEQQNVKGENVKFSEVRGKYTLIEFWASWCAPCRKLYPELKEIYAIYKKEGFEIVGVSLDEDKERWLKAIEDDGLTWINLTDSMHFENEPVIIYNVIGIPDNLLIDEHGIIVGRNLDIETLKNKLEALVGI